MADKDLKEAKEDEDRMRAAIADNDDPNIEPHGLDWLKNQEDQDVFSAVIDNAFESAQIQELQIEQ
jgi:hypothetical protein